MLLRIVVIPVMIGHLGMSGFGVWAVLMSIATYITLGGAGVKSAFQKYVAEATGTGDFDQASVESVRAQRQSFCCRSHC